MPSDYEELEDYLRAEKQKFDSLSSSMASLRERLDAMLNRLEGDAA